MWHPIKHSSQAELFISDFMRRIQGLEFTHEQADLMKREIAIRDRKVSEEKSNDLRRN